jgi:hypothetical protein
MNALVKIPVPQQEESDVAMFASLTRVLEQAPTQNRLMVFRMMVRTAVSSLATHRLEAIDDLWGIARDTGLIDLVGVTAVQAAMASEFDRGRQ